MRWLVVVGLVACGDNLVVDEPAISHGGDRLELYWNELDGARELASLSYYFNGQELERTFRMFDTVRQQDCELTEWADGTWRCTPGLHRLNALAVFADSGCTALRGLSSGFAESFLYGEWISDRFITAAVVFPASPSDEQQEYYERRDGVCVGPIPTEGKLMWNVNGGIQASELVAFSQNELSTTNRVGHRAFVGDDGTLVHDGYYDRELSAECFLASGEGDTRCVPTDVASPERTFADEACNQPAVANTAVRFLYEVAELTGCPIVHELDEPRMMPVYELDGGRCIQTEVGMYRVGRPIEPPPVEVVLADGPGRIVEVLAAGAPVGVFDTEIRASCSARDTFPFHSDPRCLPNPGGQVSEFSDDACTEPIAVTLQGARVCDWRTRFATDDYETYREVGEPIDTLFTLIDNVCVPLVPPDGHRYHRLGERQVAHEELSRAQLVHAR